ncbi:MAG TPA: hypothetical protein PKV72_05925, partial [Candidatus Peribacteria bacterium]|nr:hypothetical protein [Candidatus Peribacteria bacterium]
MGIFSFNFGNKQASSPAPSQTQPPAQQTQSAPQRTAPAQTPAPAKQVTVQVVSEPVKPVEEKFMRRLMFRPSSTDPAKLESFFKEVIRRANGEWHHIPGRIGLSNDHKQLYIEVKATRAELTKIKEFCRTGYAGIQAYPADLPEKPVSLVG